MPLFKLILNIWYKYISTLSMHPSFKRQACFLIFLDDSTDAGAIFLNYLWYCMDS